MARARPHTDVSSGYRAAWPERPASMDEQDSLWAWAPHEQEKDMLPCLHLHLQCPDGCASLAAAGHAHASSVIDTLGRVRLSGEMRVCMCRTPYACAVHAGALPHPARCAWHRNKETCPRWKPADSLGSQDLTRIKTAGGAHLRGRLVHGLHALPEGSAREHVTCG